MLLAVLYVGSFTVLIGQFFCFCFVFHWETHTLDFRVHQSQVLIAKPE